MFKTYLARILILMATLANPLSAGFFTKKPSAPNIEILKKKWNEVQNPKRRLWGLKKPEDQSQLITDAIDELKKYIEAFIETDDQKIDNFIKDDKDFFLVLSSALALNLHDQTRNDLKSNVHKLITRASSFITNQLVTQAEKQNNLSQALASINYTAKNSDEINKSDIQELKNTSNTKNQIIKLLDEIQLLKARIQAFRNFADCIQGMLDPTPLETSPSSSSPEHPTPNQPIQPAAQQALIVSANGSNRSTRTHFLDANTIARLIANQQYARVMRSFLRAAPQPTPQTSQQRTVANSLRPGSAFRPVLLIQGSGEFNHPSSPRDESLNRTPPHSPASTQGLSDSPGSSQATTPEGETPAITPRTTDDESAPTPNTLGNVSKQLQFNNQQTSPTATTVRAADKREAVHTPNEQLNQGNFITSPEIQHYPSLSNCSILSVIALTGASTLQWISSRQAKLAKQIIRNHQEIVDSWNGLPTTMKVGGLGLSRSESSTLSSILAKYKNSLSPSWQPTKKMTPCRSNTIQKMLKKHIQAYRRKRWGKKIVLCGSLTALGLAGLTWATCRK